MTKLHTILVILGFLFGFFLLPKIVHGHEWYDGDCCSEEDCAPVTKIEKSNDPNTDIMTTRNGTYMIRKNGGHSVRPSKDSEFHVCANPNRIICVYVPPLY